MSLVRPPALLRVRRDVVPAVVAMCAVYSVTRLGLAARVTDTVPRMLGREATPFERFARDYRACW